MNRSLHDINEIELGPLAAAWLEMESTGEPEGRIFHVSLQAWLTTNPEGPHQRELRKALK